MTMTWIAGAVIGTLGIIASVIGLAFKAGQIVRCLKDIEAKLHILTTNDLPHLYQSMNDLRIDLAKITARLDALTRDLERAG